MNLTMKNKQTGKTDVIEQRDVTQKDWGFSFFTDSEIEAFKAAYLYRNSEHGVKVEFADGVKRWMVTVFNQTGADLGFNR